MKRRLATMTLALVLVTGIAPARSAFAATQTDLLEDAAVYHTPSNDYKSGDCILTATKSMIRRASIIRGSKAWESITNKTLRKSATISGLLLNSFTFEADGLSYKVACGWFSGKNDAARIKEFDALIKEHPEGFVVWGSNSSKYGMHGVLVTAVKNGVVYAADSVYNTGSYSKGIQKWSSTSMKAVSKVTKYWYIKEVGLAKNASQPAAGEPIRPISASDVNYASTLSINSATIPEKVDQGCGYPVRGAVNSNYRISKVTVGVYDASGKAMTAKSANPKAWSYDLSKLDKYVTFGILPAGKYNYKITATDEKKTAVLVNAVFTVKGVSKLRIKSYNRPRKIRQGRSFTIKGKVSSNYKLTNVTVMIQDADGETVCMASVDPNAKSYRIKKLDRKIKFGTLEKGTYRYIIKASDKIKTETLLNKKFKVY